MTLEQGLLLRRESRLAAGDLDLSVVRGGEARHQLLGAAHEERREEWAAQPLEPGQDHQQAPGAGRQGRGQTTRGPPAAAGEVEEQVALLESRRHCQHRGGRQSQSISVAADLDLDGSSAWANQSSELATVAADAEHEVAGLRARRRDDFDHVADVDGPDRRLVHHQPRHDARREAARGLRG